MSTKYCLDLGFDWNASPIGSIIADKKGTTASVYRPLQLGLVTGDKDAKNYQFYEDDELEIWIFNLGDDSIGARPITLGMSLVDPHDYTVIRADVLDPELPYLSADGEDNTEWTDFTEKQASCWAFGFPEHDKQFQCWKMTDAPTYVFQNLHTDTAVELSVALEVSLEDGTTASQWYVSDPEMWIEG